MDRYEQAFYEKDRLLEAAAKQIDNRSKFTMMAIDFGCDALNKALLRKLPAQEQLAIRGDVKTVKDFVTSETFARLTEIFKKEGNQTND